MFLVTTANSGQRENDDHDEDILSEDMYRVFLAVQTRV